MTPARTLLRCAGEPRHTPSPFRQAQGPELVERAARHPSQEGDQIHAAEVPSTKGVPDRAGCVRLVGTFQLKTPLRPNDANGVGPALVAGPNSNRRTARRQVAPLLPAEPDPFKR